jgi:hypothetical protein
MEIKVLIFALPTATAGKASMLFLNGKFLSLQDRHHITVVKNAPILFLCS